MSKYDVVRIIRELGGEARPKDIAREAIRQGIYSGNSGNTPPSAALAGALRSGWLERRMDGKTGAVFYRVTPEAP